MTAIRFTFEGDKAMKQKLRNVAGDKGMRKIARGAALEVAGEFLIEMKAGTPFKTGKLRNSEKIRVLVSSKKEDIRITMVAGGPEAPYAWIVHERHKKKPKFMESVILEHAPTAGQEIAAKIDLRQAVQG